ncbi:MAG TPA: substrate-binding domain-containing protein, partial [Ktedonobacteraceae bacterium]
EHGYLLVICSVARNAIKNLHAEDRYIEVLASAPVAGVIIVPVYERMKALDLLRERQVPIVVVDQNIRDPSIDTVRIDNVLAAKEAANHLLAQGYRRIGIITGHKTAATANERLQGYRQALREAGLSEDAALEYRGSFTEETGERSTCLLLDQHIDALLATNNMITVGAVRALYARQKRIPEDVALVGFDEVPWAPDFISITTITQPAYELGRTSALRLIQRLRQPDAPRHEIVLPHKLIVRRSSALRQKQKMHPGEVSSPSA